MNQPTTVMHRLYVYRFMCFACLATLFVACEDCGLTDEPELQLSLQSTKSIQIDTVYAVGAVKALSNSSVKASGQYVSLTLPLSLHADSTQYKLRLNGRTETITVFYRRNFSYKSKKCGYVVNLYAPYGKEANTTAGKVINAGYSQTIYKSGFLSGGSPTGILLFIGL